MFTTFIDLKPNTSGEYEVAKGVSAPMFRAMLVRKCKACTSGRFCGLESLSLSQWDGTVMFLECWLHPMALAYLCAAPVGRISWTSTSPV